jgi:hypothetical protein
MGMELRNVKTTWNNTFYLFLLQGLSKSQLASRHNWHHLKISNWWIMSQPHFEASVRMRLTLPKVGIGGPPRLPQLQSSTAEGKTPRLEVFFIPLERTWSVDVENGLAWIIWTSLAQVMGKRRVENQTGSLTPDHKSQESTWSRCVQMDCDTPFESSWGELQVCFRPHHDPRFELRVMSSQSPGIPNQDSFETPPWESRE